MSTVTISVDTLDPSLSVPPSMLAMTKRPHQQQHEERDDQDDSIEECDSDDDSPNSSRDTHPHITSSTASNTSSASSSASSSVTNSANEHRPSSPRSSDRLPIIDNIASTRIDAGAPVASSSSSSSSTTAITITPPPALFHAASYFSNGQHPLLLDNAPHLADDDDNDHPGRSSPPPSPQTTAEFAETLAGKVTQKMLVKKPSLTSLDAVIGERARQAIEAKAKKKKLDDELKRRAKEEKKILNGLLKDMDACEKGTVVWKVAREGRFHPIKQCTMQLVKLKDININSRMHIERAIKDNAFGVIWGSKKDTEDSIFVLSPTTLELYEGQSEGSFPSKLRYVQEHCGEDRAKWSFSMRNDKRGLDIVTTSQEDYDIWMRIITWITSLKPAPPQRRKSEENTSMVFTRSPTNPAPSTPAATSPSPAPAAH